MKTAVKILLLSLPFTLLAVCSLQAKESDSNAPPPPQAVSPSHEHAGEPGPGPEGTEPNRFHPRAPMEGRGDQPMDFKDREKIREHMQTRENELIAWLEKNEPAKAKELTALKEKDRPAYMRRMMLEMKNYRQIMETEQSNPALAEVLKKDLALKQKRNELLEQIKGTTDEAKKKELTNQLKTVVGDSFDLVVQKKQLKYEELKKRLEELQQNVKKSQAELESIKSKKTEQVEQRLKELLSQSEKIDWD
jgi:hypothetical protein